MLNKHAPNIIGNAEDEEFEAEMDQVLNIKPNNSAFDRMMDVGASEP